MRVMEEVTQAYESKKLDVALFSKLKSCTPYREGQVVRTNDVTPH